MIVHADFHGRSHVFQLDVRPLNVAAEPRCAGVGLDPGSVFRVLKLNSREGDVLYGIVIR